MVFFAISGGSPNLNNNTGTICSLLCVRVNADSAEVYHMFAQIILNIILDTIQIRFTEPSPAELHGLCTIAIYKNSSYAKFVCSGFLS